MNKHIRALLAFSAICVSTTAIPAFAADSQAIRVKVPFAFTAGTTNLPAGDYTVSQDTPHVLTIWGSGGSASVFETTGMDVGSDRTGLTFERTAKGRPSNVTR
jgi:hypothetical protein